MDWASSLWKQDLTPLAVQKVNGLEDKIEKLLKERDQKQIKVDWLTAELEKEQRKGEIKNQDAIATQRELQSIQNTCKEFENKQKKLLNEIQIRDARINSLEGILAKAKKENSMLQQHNKDIKDLKFIEKSREKSKETLNSSMGLNKSDIHDCTINESSFLYNKENNRNGLNDSIYKQDSLNQTLKVKIAEQEAIIKDLKSKLEFATVADVGKGNAGFISSTPAKRMNVTDSSIFPGKEDFNFFDSFTSTPAKNNRDRILKHHSETNESGNNEAIALEHRNKQLRQELDCQRHNFEASKIAIETKYKEIENSLKEGLKHHIKACTDLEKELQDLKLKYQQESTQSQQKLDVLTLQLRNSEQAKSQLENDLKRVEGKLSSTVQNEQKKEEEFQECQKQIKASEMAKQSLLFQKSEVEKKSADLQKEILSLNEQIRLARSEIENNNCIIKEKENNLSSMKKEIEAFSLTCNNLNVVTKELQNNINSMSSENAKLQNELKESLCSESALKEVIQHLEVQNIELTSSLKLQLNKAGEFERTINEKEQSIYSLEAKIKDNLSSLQIHKNDLKGSLSRESALKETIEQLEKVKINAISSFEAEVSKTKEQSEIIKNRDHSIISLETKVREVTSNLETLKAELQKSFLSESTLKENIKQLKEEINSLTSTLESEVKEKNMLSLCLEEEMTKRKQLEEKLSFNESALKDNIKKFEDQNKELSSCKAQLDKTKENEKIIEEKEQSIKSLEAKIQSYSLDLETSKTNLQKSVSNESALKEIIKELEKTKSDVISSFEAEVRKVDKLSEVIKNKDLSITFLETESQKTCSELEMLKTDLQKILSSESALKESIEQLEKAKINAISSFEAEVSKTKEQSEIIKNRDHSIISLETKVHEVTSNLEILKISVKEMEEKNKGLISTLETEIKEKNDLSLSLEEEIAKRKQLEENLSFNESALEENIKQLEDQKKELSSFKQLDKSKEYEKIIEEKEENINSLESKICNFSLNLENIKEELQKCLSNESALKENINQLEKAKADVVSLFEAEVNKTKELSETIKNRDHIITSLETKIREMMSNLEALKADLQKSLKSDSALKESIKEYEEKINSLNSTLEFEVKEKNKLSSLLVEESTKRKQFEEMIKKKEKDIILSETKITEISSNLETTNAKLEKISSNEAVLSKNIKQLENEKNELFSSLKAQLDKTKECQKIIEEKELSITSHEAKMKDYLSSLETHKNDLQQSLLRESALKESINQLEKSKVDVISSIEVEVNKSKEQSEIIKNRDHSINSLESKIRDMASNLEILNADLQKSLLNESTLIESIKQLKEKNNNLTSTLESQNEEKNKLSLSLEEEMAIRKQLEDNLSFSESALKENVKQLEDKEKELYSFETELKKTKEYKKIIEEKEQNIISLESEIKEYSSSLETLQSNLQKSLSNESALKETIDQLEKTKTEVKEQFEIIKNKDLDINSLESKIHEMSCDLEMLRADLQKSVLSESDLKENIKLLEEKVDSLTYTLESEIKKKDDIESALKESIKQLEEENKDLASTLKWHEEKSNVFEKDIKVKEQSICSLETTLQQFSLKLELLKNDLNKCSLNELALNENLRKLEEENSNLSSSLKDKTDKTEEFEKVHKDKEQSIVLLETKVKEMSFNLEIEKNKLTSLLEVKINEIKELENNLKLKEENIQLLETKVCEVSDSLEGMKGEKSSYEVTLQLRIYEISNEKATLQKLLEESSCVIKNFEAKLETMEIEKYSIGNLLIEESEKSQELDLKVAELKLFILSLGEDLAHISDLVKSNEEYERKVENELSILEKESKYLKEANTNLMIAIEEKNQSITNLQEEILQKTSEINKLQENLCNNQFEMANLQKEKINLSSSSEKLELRIAELEKCVIIAKDELDSMSKELDSEKGNMCLKEKQTGELERKLSILQEELDSTKKLLNESSTFEKCLKDKVCDLEKEKYDLTVYLKTESSKIEALELTCIELQNKALDLETDLSTKETELEKAVQSLSAIRKYEEQIEELNTRLSTLQQELGSTKSLLNESSTLEKYLKDKVCGLEREKYDLTACLKTKDDKIEILELDAIDLHNEVFRVEEELSSKTLELEKAVQHLPSVIQYQKKIQELEDGILLTKSENKLLSSHLKNAKSNQELSFRKLNNFECERKHFSLLTKEADKTLTDIKENIFILQSTLLDETKNTVCNNSYEFDEKSIFRNIFLQACSIWKTVAFDFYNQVIEHNLCYPENSQIKNWSIITLHCLEAIETKVFEKIENCKFLYANHLLSETELKDMMKLAMFLKKQFSQVKKIKVQVHFVSTALNLVLVANDCKELNNISILQKYLVQIKNFINIDALSQSCKVNSQCIMNNVNSRIKEYVNSMKQHFSLIDGCQNIESVNLHLPTVQSTRWIVYLYKINNQFIKHHYNLLSAYKLKQNFVCNIFEDKSSKELIERLDILQVTCVLDFYIKLTNILADNFADMVNTKSSVQVQKQLDFSEIKQLFIIFHKFIKAKKLSFLEELHQWVEYLKAFSNNLNITPFKWDSLQMKKNYLEKLKHSKTEVKLLNEKCDFCETIEQEKEALKCAIKIEKEKHCLLNSTIEEIEQDLSDTFMQKEKLHNILSQVCEMLKYFKDLLTPCTFSDLEVFYEFATKICLCEQCISQPSSEMLHTEEEMPLLEGFVLCIKNVINKSKKMENEITEMKYVESQQIGKLHDESKSLQENIKHLENKLKELNFEKINLEAEHVETTKKCETLSFLLEEKNTSILKLELEKEEFNIFFKQCESKLKACEEQLCKFSVDKDAFKQEVNVKEEKISLLEKVISDQNKEIEHNSAQTLEYETRINLLKNELNELDGKLSVINELKETADVLNLKIKDTENELKKAYSEKQSTEDELNKLAEDNIIINKDILTWKEMYNSEKLSNTELNSKLKKLGINLTETTHSLNHFKTSLHNSEKDISDLKNLQIKHEHTINLLEEKNKEYENWNKSLSCKYDQLEKFKSSLLHQLEEKNKLILGLENKIADLSNQSKAVEDSNKELLISSSNVKLEIDSLNKELTLNKRKNANLQTDLEREVELCKSLKQEILEKSKIIESLNMSIKEQATKNNIYISDITNEKEELIQKGILLNEKITIMKKDMCAVKYSLELMENNCLKLSRENKLLKEKESVNDSIMHASRYKEVEHAFSKTIKFLQSLLDIIVDMCSTFENKDLITNLTDVQKQLNQKSVRHGIIEVEFQSELLKSLSIALKNNLRNTDEDLKIVDFISSISSFIKSIGPFIESHKTEKKFLEETVNVTLNESLIAGAGDIIKFSHSQVQKELQQAQVQLSEYFSVLKIIICKQEEEIKDLKFKLKQLTLPVNSINPKNQDVNLKNKLSLMKMNSKRWEIETNKMKELCSNLKGKIKVLEEKLLTMKNEYESKFKELNEEKSEIETELQQQIDKLKKENAEIDKEAEELSEDCKTFLRERDEYSASVFELREKLKLLEKESEKTSISDKSCRYPLDDKENFKHID